MSRLGAERLRHRVNSDYFQENEQVKEEKTVDKSVKPSVNIEPLNYSEDLDDTPLYTDQSVNAIFINFYKDNKKKLKSYLNYFADHPDAPLPHPLVIHRNKYFESLRNDNLSPEGIKIRFNIISGLLQLTPFQASILRYVLEKSGYIAHNIASTDVIVLDFDTMGFYGGISSSTALARENLNQYIQEVVKRYKLNGRSVEFVVFSKRSNIMQMQALLGENLFATLRSAGNKIYSRELIDQLESRYGPKKYRNFLAILMSEYNNLNRTNFKIFSDRDIIMDSAKSLGMIMADRDDTVFNALRIFANLHPNASANLPLRQSFLMLRDMAYQSQQGYFSLAGEEFSYPKSRRVSRRLSKLRLLYQSL